MEIHGAVQMPIPSERKQKTRRLGPLLALGAFAALGAGCQAIGAKGPATTGSLRPTNTLVSSDMNQQAAVSAVRTWGQAYARNEKDKQAALNYAAALRAAGEKKQAVAVMRKAVIYHPKDRSVLAAFGKALADDGQFQEALSVIQRAQQQDNPDWQLLAAEGGILDSLGDSRSARERYRQALVLAPGEPQVLNNLAMSYVLTSQLSEAEATLRQALASPKATARTQQNLALVLALQSKGGAAPKAATNRTASAGETGPAPSPALPAQENVWAEIKKSG
ncbi:tetratricopeptide repeat protein [Faunimonas sp. B44]|uniref:tetratricopeptide repeat protein n=1 Tax=Faunimonas sp. B44 TaxID=3461493 RepID=UPI0040450E85